MKRRANDVQTSGRQDVVAAACIEMGVPPHKWARVSDAMKIAARLGATPTRETIKAAIEAMGPEFLRALPPLPKPPKPEPVVYYIRFGDRIKIGTTVNLKERLRDLPHDELLATEPGSYAVEKRRHQQFAADRVVGEWFHVTPALLEHIEGLV